MPHVSLLLSVGSLLFACSRQDETGAPARIPPEIAATAISTQAAQSARSTNDAALDDANIVAVLLEALPAHAGSFTGGPVTQQGITFVRRTYGRGEARINVTISSPGVTPINFEDWVNMSADSPQVPSTLVSPSAGAGFYDCVGEHAQGICNVHIQLRSGHHIEMMGERKAYRSDFDALLTALPLSKLAH